MVAINPEANTPIMNECFQTSFYLLPALFTLCLSHDESFCLFDETFVGLKWINETSLY